MVEILPFSLRAKGVSYFNFIQGCALIVNQFANPIALAAIKWKYYGVYVALSCLYAIAATLLFPETRGLTAEEVGSLFDKGTEHDTLAVITANRNEEALKGDKNSGEIEEIEKIEKI